MLVEYVLVITISNLVWYCVSCGFYLRTINSIPGLSNA